ncbi:MAG: hypothetical protein F6K28_43850 [Microcoleus sp. SIO2G3]|nr:hypothetical protein [Microcoleus sp. SIO2G3]
MGNKVLYLTPIATHKYFKLLCLQLFLNILRANRIDTRKRSPCGKLMKWLHTTRLYIPLQLIEFVAANGR